MTTKQLGTRHDEKLIARLGLRAELSNSSLTQLVNDGLELYVGFDDRFLKGLKGLASDLGIEPSDLIQRILAERMGTVDAYVEIYGDYPYLARDTVSQGDFEADYNMHKQAVKQKLEKEELEKALEIESFGGSLEDYQERLLMKYQIGKVWENSREYKQRLELLKHLEEKYPEATRRQKEHHAKIRAEREVERAAKKED